MPPWTNPSVSDFQAFFQRDFPYGSDITTSITPTDIANAINSAAYSINPGMFGDQGSYNIAFLNLAAHFLVMSIRTSSQGIVGQYNFLQNSKGVGSVSESFNIPPRITNDPYLSMFAKTNYGATYLMIVLPQLNGAMLSVCGQTKP